MEQINLIHFKLNNDVECVLCESTLPLAAQATLCVNIYTHIHALSFRLFLWMGDILSCIQQPMAISSSRYNKSAAVFCRPDVPKCTTHLSTAEMISLMRLAKIKKKIPQISFFSILQIRIFCFYMFSVIANWKSLGFGLLFRLNYDTWQCYFGKIVKLLYFFTSLTSIILLLPLSPKHFVLSGDAVREQTFFLICNLLWITFLWRLFPPVLLTFDHL